MTIVAGFKSPEGIVLCADTQETVGESKRNVPKLRFEPSGRGLYGVPENELAVAFCGAGNNGVFMDEMVDNAWKDVQTAANIDEACDLIKTSIKRYYREAKQNYQTGYCPETELIYGIKMHGASRLFYALGPAVAERDRYATGGQGVYLADFIASRIYSPYLTMSQCLILAAYILYEAKENVVGCGGDSHIAVLQDHGLSGRVNLSRIETINEFVSAADIFTGNLLLHAANFTLKDETFQEIGNNTVKSLELLRSRQTSAIEDHAKVDIALRRPIGGEIKHKADEFGFLIPLDDQTSKDRQ